MTILLNVRVSHTLGSKVMVTLNCGCGIIGVAVVAVGGPGKMEQGARYEGSSGSQSCNSITK